MLGAHALIRGDLDTAEERLLFATELIEVDTEARARLAVVRALSGDKKGRVYVAVEIDLGHYNRQRVLDKLRAFKQEENSREMWRVAPTDERRIRAPS